MAIKIPTPGVCALCNPVPLSVDVDCEYDGTFNFMMRWCYMAQLILKVIVLSVPDIIR